MTQTDMTFIEVSEDINATVEKVWRNLTNVNSWAEWWLAGSKLSKVDPRWQLGAKLVWDKGPASTIRSFEPRKLLEFDSWYMNLDCSYEYRIYFKLTSDDTQLTKVIHGFSIERKWGTSLLPPGFNTDVSKNRMAKSVRQLKRRTERKWWQLPVDNG